MKLQYASFLLPLHVDSLQQEDLNRFLRGRRVIQTHKQLVSIEGATCWAILVEYLDSQEKSTGEIKSKVDYKEVLLPKIFRYFQNFEMLEKNLPKKMGCLFMQYAPTNNWQK